MRRVESLFTDLYPALRILYEPAETTADAPTVHAAEQLWSSMGVRLVAGPRLSYVVVWEVNASICHA